MNEQHSEREMPFLEHLEELRWGIIRSLAALVIGMIICFVGAQYILDVLTYPTTSLKSSFSLQMLKVQGKLTAYLEIGFFGGFVLALPYILIQIWRFISPGLERAERFYIVPLFGAAIGLFLGGITFAYLVIIPFALEFLVGLPPYTIEAHIAIDFYIGFVIRLMLIFGIVFELPVLSYFLAKMGMINTELMRKYRRHAVVLIFVLAALLTPPDPITQVLLGIPLVLLYEISIGIVWSVEKKQNTREIARDSDTQKPQKNN